MKTSSNIGNNKSFVYDLNKELGIVRIEWPLCHDLLRLSLCSGDLFLQLFTLPGVCKWGAWDLVENLVFHNASGGLGTQHARPRRVINDVVGIKEYQCDWVHLMTEKREISAGEKYTQCGRNIHPPIQTHLRQVTNWQYPPGGRGEGVVEREWAKPFHIRTELLH